MGGTTKAAEVLQSGALVLRLNSDNAQDGASIADYLTNTLRAKRIDFVALQGAYGQGALASIKASLGPDSKITNTFFAPPDTTNFQSIVTSIAADQPDAVVWAIFGNAQPVAFMRQYRQSGIRAPLVAAAGTLTSSLVQAAGGAAEGVVSADLWTVDLETPANRALKTAFERHKGQHPECSGKPLDKQVAITYSQLLLLSQGIAKADSVDPARVRETLLKGTWDLPQGTVRFNPDGQAQVKYSMLVAKGNEVVALKR
jgi:branched-chain amino acid transport system substrate-binding protein